MLFISNFNMTLESKGMLVTSENIKYFHTLVHGKALHKFYTLSDEVGSATSENLKSIILGSSTYIFPINVILKKSRQSTAECRSHAV